MTTYTLTFLTAQTVSTEENKAPPLWSKWRLLQNEEVDRPNTLFYY